MPQAPMLKGAWSDAEKLALLLSIIKSTGTVPRWSNGIAVPQGRTLQASQKMYGEILKGAASVKMTEGEEVTPSGKRARGAAAATKGSDDEDEDEEGGAAGGGGNVGKKRQKMTNGNKPKKGKKGSSSLSAAKVVDGDAFGEENDVDDDDDETGRDGEVEVKNESIV